MDSSVVETPTVKFKPGTLMNMIAGNRRRDREKEREYYNACRVKK